MEPGKCRGATAPVDAVGLVASGPRCSTMAAAKAWLAAKENHGRSAAPTPKRANEKLLSGLRPGKPGGSPDANLLSALGCALQDSNRCASSDDPHAALLVASLVLSVASAAAAPLGISSRALSLARTLPRPLSSTGLATSRSTTSANRASVRPTCASTAHSTSPVHASCCSTGPSAEHHISLDEL